MKNSPPVLPALPVAAATAIHSHVTHEEPRILFFYYWGRGTARELAEAIKGAILGSHLTGVSASR